jgi:hypothetical protein
MHHQSPSCYVIESISKPFNDGTLVEVKFAMTRCRGTEAEMFLRVPVEAAKAYMVGDTYMMQMRRI